MNYEGGGGTNIDFFFYSVRGRAFRFFTLPKAIFFANAQYDMICHRYFVPVVLTRTWSILVQSPLFVMQHQNAMVEECRWNQEESIAVLVEYNRDHGRDVFVLHEFPILFLTNADD